MSDAEKSPLVLAVDLEFHGRYGYENEEQASKRRVERNAVAAAELRRLSAELAALKAAIEAQGVPDGWQLVRTDVLKVAVDFALPAMKRDRDSPSNSAWMVEAADRNINAVRALLTPAPQAEELVQWKARALQAEAVVAKFMEPQASLEQQEPFGWVMQWPNHSPSFTTNKSDYASWFAGKASYPDELVPLYTHPAPQGVPDALREEAMNLASILSGMVEGGYSDLETLYTEDQADGDAFVKRAAEVLDLLASAPPAPQADKYVPCPYCGKNTASDNPSQWCPCPTRASVVQQEPANVRWRWNIELDGDDLLVCFNDHDKGESCSYQRYVPAPQAKPQPLSDEQIEIFAIRAMNACGCKTMKTVVPFGTEVIPMAKHMARAIESAACADRDSRIADLEQRNRDLHEDVKRFRNHALNEKDARMALERELSEVRKDAERYRWLLDNYATGDGYDLIDRALNDGEADTQLTPAIDAAMKGQQ